MFDTAIVFALLIVTTILLAYSAALGRLENRAILIVIPATTIMLSALTLIVKAENLLLLAIVGSVMAGVAFILMVYAIITMVRYNRGDTAREVGRGDSRGAELEA